MLRQICGAERTTFVSSFRITKQQWDARKDLNFTFAFQYQPSLVLTPHSAITEQ